MTVLQVEAEKRFGSLRGAATALGLSPGAIHQVSAGHRRAWPKLRRDLAAVLEVEERDLFDDQGWLKKFKNGGE